MDKPASYAPKILMLNSTRGFIGGVERLMVNMSRALAENSWQVYGLFEHSEYEEPDFDSAFVEIKIWHQASLAALIEHYQRLQIDIVCIHKTEQRLWVSQLQAAFKTVLIVHDHDYYCLRRHKYFPWRRRNCHLPFGLLNCSLCSALLRKRSGRLEIINACSRLQLLRQMRKCDLSFVLSEHMQQNLLMNGWERASIRRLLPFLDIAPSPVKAASTVPLILYVGQLIRGKGVDLLLHALASLKLDYCCKILGRGNDQAFLEKLAIELGISSKVHFMGFSPNLNSLYAEASLLVVPSRWQEPFALVGLEAFAHRVPVVAFDTGGISEWLKHRVNGLLVRAGDCPKLAQAIELLLGDHELAAKYAEAGYRMVSEQYTREAFQASLIPHLEGLLPAASKLSNQPSIHQPSFVQTLLSRCLAIVFSVLISLPLALYLLIRDSIGKGLLREGKLVYGSGSEPVYLQQIKSSNWLLRNALLFPMAVLGKIALVGISFRDYQPQNQIPPELQGHKPGLFNLHFIRSSSKIALSDQDQNDRDYLQGHSLFTDLLLILQSIPAIVYYHDAPSLDAAMDIFGIRILNLSMAEAIEQIHSRLRQGQKSEVFFVNADCLNKVFVDRDYYDILRDSHLVYPDGIGINLAGKLLGSPLKENVNGTDLLPHLCEMAQARGYKLYLLGAAEGVAEAMQARLLMSYPRLLISGTRHGFFDWDSQADSVIQEINLASADILLVAFGAPQQEKFIHKYAARIDARILLGVGGLFDFYSGNIARAPLWMRQTGLEWVFRLIQEPKRMWKRYIIGNPLFLYRVFRWKIDPNYGRFKALRPEE